MRWRSAATPAGRLSCDQAELELDLRKLLGKAGKRERQTILDAIEAIHELARRLNEAMARQLEPRFELENRFPKYLCHCGYETGSGVDFSAHMIKDHPPSLKAGLGVKCPQCQAELVGPANGAGQVTCPGCGHLWSEVHGQRFATPAAIEAAERVPLASLTDTQLERLRQQYAAEDLMKDTTDACGKGPDA